jgi:hypothetical protein
MPILPDARTVGAEIMLLLSMLLVAVSAPPAPAANAKVEASVLGVAARDPGPPRWEVSMAVVSETAAVLPGLAIGAAGEVARRLGRGPWFVSGQLVVASASGANPSWTIDHRQMALALGVGIETELGVGKLWAEAGGGLLGLEEILGRHQLERIQMAELGGGTETSFGLGPLGFAEVGVALRLLGPLRARISGGPVVSRIDLTATGASWRLGAASKLGISYEF